jgi:hypothetical protein
MEVYFAVLDDGMLELGNQVYKDLFDNTDDYILDSVDRDKLWECIEVLCRIRKIEWKEPASQVKTKDGKNMLTVSYPDYPQALSQVFEVLGVDHNYVHNMERLEKGLVPTEMSASQIKTMLTAINRGERFCDGNIAGALEDGTLLKLLLRIDDLLIQRKYG